ncbi:MAG: phospho-N-acetylmuramoyl-pentapeptide-transferase [Oscillospiraceae bacterium]|nr:phospho-N-acetylmuramoyl-pentapeptide-transferase [Oscillospiraceae bacterium]
MYICKTILLISFFAALFITYFIGTKLIPILKRIKCSQTTKEIGPTWHEKKSGTPTMGGLMMIAGILTASIVGFVLLKFKIGEMATSLNLSMLLANLFMALGFALIGFMDDYIKVIKKQNLGLRAREKFGLQFLVALAYILQISFLNGHNGILWLPFCGQVDIGWAIYPVYLFIILGCVNAVNITDGLDGLASGVTCVSALGFLACAMMLGNWLGSVLAISLAGGCIGFLFWNFYPAMVMMGDTGALFLGGMLVAIAFSLNLQVALAFFGIVYVLETLSVIVQMTYFHFTKKRIFKMSPIHHHFELSGYSEVQINIMMMTTQFVGCILGVISVAVR